jgi:hypothetical protein
VLQATTKPKEQLWEFKYLYNLISPERERDSENDRQIFRWKGKIICRHFSKMVSGSTYLRKL